MRSFLPDVLLCLSLALTGCEGASSLSAPGAQRSGETPSKTELDDRRPVVGATVEGVVHNISDTWEPVPFEGGNNVKFLSFAQMQREVERATRVQWGGWDALRVPFGAPDFQTRYSEDRIPTGSKVVAWRKMAYDVCGTMVAREADLPAIGTGSPEVRERARILWVRFFQEPPADPDLELLVQTLEVLAANGSTTDAWTGACAGLLSSIKFLSY